MGLGFVLLIWAVIGFILAGIGAGILGSAAAYLTRGSTQGRKRLILAWSLFPLICLGWLGGIFVFQAIINATVLHRDVGLGDTWTSPLPNGYALMMIDTTDQGWVYNPKTQPQGVGEQDDAIAGVRVVQVAGRYILGGSDTRSFEESESSSDQVNSYFVLDTQIGQHTDYPSYEALRGRARELGIVLHLEPIDTVYGRYRFTWFDLFVGLLAFLPPLAGAVFLIKWIIRLRKTRENLNLGTP